MRSKISFRGFLIYCVVATLMLIIFTYVFYFFVELSEEELRIVTVDNSIERVFLIIKNNSVNYLGYLLAALIYPLFAFLDLVSTSWSISVSLHAQGVIETLRHLVCHGIIELPNVFMYTYLSFGAFVQIIRNKDFGIKEYVRYIYERRLFYALSFVLVIAAGFVEGLLS